MVRIRAIPFIKGLFLAYFPLSTLATGRIVDHNAAGCFWVYGLDNQFSSVFLKILILAIAVKWYFQIVWIDSRKCCLAQPPGFDMADPLIPTTIS